MDKHSIFDNIRKIHEKINRAALRAGRDPNDIKLIAVTKTIGVERIREAIDAGLRAFGENKVQEAQKKATSNELIVTSGKIEWHLIGHLQKNKAKYAVSLFDLIHSLDSIELAVELNKQAEKIGKVQNVLIEVKLSHEETKHGVSEDELLPLVQRIQGSKNIRLLGLMTMPPYFEDPEKARPYFRRLHEIRDSINELRVTSYTSRELSMGMSNDFEVAIEEGATIVRIGTAIFGERQ